MNKKWMKTAQRFFALFLCAAMLLPMLPQVVTAAEPTYPNAGSVMVNKVGITSQADFDTNGVAQIQLSTTAIPADKDVDLIIMVDLSSSMRVCDGVFDDKGNTVTVEPFYNPDRSQNTKVIYEDWKKTRMYKMEQSLRALVASIQTSVEGTDRKVNICIANFGDLDHYDFSNATVKNEPGTNRPMLDINRDNGFQWYQNAEHWGGSNGYNPISEFANHKNYVLSSIDSHKNSNPFYDHNWKFYNTSELLQGRKDPEVYTGANTVTNAFTDATSLTDMNGIISALRMSNSMMLGTNYDVGLEYAYKIAASRKNSDGGKDNEQVCIFMSDGAPTQYNYFSGHFESQAWLDTVLGVPDSLTKRELFFDMPMRDLANHTWAYGTREYEFVDIIDDMHWALHHSGYGLVNHEAKDSTNIFKTTTCYGYNTAGFFDCFKKAAGWEMNWEAFFQMIYAQFYRKNIRKINVGYDYGIEDASGKTMYHINAQWIADLFVELKTPVDSTKHETYSPYYYFYNNEGKNWWAEAMKGDTDKLYPVINKFAKGNTYIMNSADTYDCYEQADNFAHSSIADGTGKDYIAGVKGLGMDLYTVGFGLTSDNLFTVDKQEQVLKNLATNENFFYRASGTDSLTAALRDILERAVSSATRAYLVDKMGDDYDLLTSTTVPGRNGNVQVVTSNPVISVKLYNVDKTTGKPTGDALRTLETIEFTGTNVAKLTVYDAEGKEASVIADVWDESTGLISGNRVWYNTNKTGTKRISFGTEGGFDLHAETFFWSIGSIPETVIVLEYPVYLTGSMAGKYDDYASTTTHYTHQSAALTYIDYEKNQKTVSLESPKYTWNPMVQLKVVIDYGIPVDIDVVNKFTAASSYTFTASTIKVVKGTTGTYASTANGSYGDVTISGQKLRYTPKNMQMSGYDTFTCEMTRSDGLAPYYCRVLVIPATVMYYEDDAKFVTYDTYTTTVDSNGYPIDGWSKETTSMWKPDGTLVTNKVQLDDLVGSSTPYGYDSVYGNMSTHSMGQAHKVTVSDTRLATATFTFTGTGFDVISLTSSSTGTIMIDVAASAGGEAKYSNGTSYETLFVDTYYGYKKQHYELEYTYDAANKDWVMTAKNVSDTGFAQNNATQPNSPKDGDKYYKYGMEWVPSASSDTLYQIPVMKVSDLQYGTYTVTITAAYSRWLDHPASNVAGGSYDFYLDAIRTYNPAQTSNSVIQNAYGSDGEYNPTYKELRNLIISKNDFDSQDNSTTSGAATGIVFIDNTLDTKKNNVNSISDYSNYGPNNELYLAAGQSIAFNLTSADTRSDLQDLQLAMKAVNGTAEVTIQYYNGTTLTTVTGYSDKSIATCTDLYYSIPTDLVGKTVVIKNTGSNILSITNLKATSNSLTSEAAVVLSVDSDEITKVIELMNGSGDVEQPEQNQPGMEDVPDTGDVNLSMVAQIGLIASVLMLAVLTYVHTSKKNAM